MDIEVAVLFHAATDPLVAARMEMAGIDPAEFDDLKYRKAYRFALQHFKDHKTVAGLPAVAMVCGVDIPDIGIESSFAITEFLKRRMFRKISAVVEKSSDFLRQNSPEQAFETLKEFSDAEVGSVSGVNPTNLFGLGDQVKEAYLKVKNGYTGIALPWPSMTDLTMGLWPSTATYFVARPGVGKTQVATLIARDAWRNGKRVLIISPEMSKTEIAERFFIVQAGVSAGDIMRGNLPSFIEDDFFASIKKLSDQDGIYIIDSMDDLTAAGMDAAIAAVKPDVVAVDSIYMLNFKGDKMERTMRAVDWIRQSAKRHRIPFVAFHQLSRQATKDKKQGGGYDTSAIALSDQLLWDAHAVFIMEQDTDMKADRRLKFHVGKLRRGSHDGTPIEVYWDFDNMKFDEIKRDSDKSFRDADFEAF
jgi:replicative DNA helicase